MNKYVQKVLPFLLLAISISSCKKKLDDYYAVPDSKRIYQELESRGNFTKFLALIDRAGYKQTLSTAGFWTLFAPSDSAFQADTEFQAFLSSRNITGVETMDSATAASILKYLLVFNGFKKERLDDFQSSTPSPGGYVPNLAFKRRTAYYTGFYTDTTAVGLEVKAIASNRNNTNNTNYYVLADNNNKYIPFFTTEFLSANSLSPADYNYFYPNTTFSGFNVVNSKVTQQDIAADNGVIHVIDRVITPLLSLDQFLRTKPEYREFRNLFEKYMVQFIENADATHRYQVLSGKTEKVLVKQYSNLLAYSPNNENWLKLQDNDSQREGWTMMAPKNDVLVAYVNRILAEGYGSVTNLPLTIIADLLNSHMWQSTLWPSKFSSTNNFLGEGAHINSTTDVAEKRILSNGIFYGTNKVNEPNKFSTVYGKAYLNPKFTLMTRLLDNELNTIITNPFQKYTVFMMPDEVLRAQGFDFSSNLNNWTFNGVANDSFRLNLLRILNTGVIPTPNDELRDLGTPGFTGTGIAASFGGEVIKYNGNTISTAGTNDRNLTVRIDSVKTAGNGRVIYLNNLLYFSYGSVGADVAKLAATPTPATSQYSIFWDYFKNSIAYDLTTNNAVGMAAGSFYTLFVPNNNAMRAAITAGLLPGTAAVPNTNPTSTPDKALVEKFILYHVIDKRTIIPDNRDIGNYPTLLKNNVGDPVFVNISYPAGIFEISDAANRKARLVPVVPNNSTLSNRTVIHLIDNYLKYN